MQAQAPAASVFDPQAFLAVADRVFDPTSDALNFEDGTFVWKGRTFNLSEARVFRARFERFLGTDPTEDYEGYQALLNQILQKLSVSEGGGDENLFAAWDLLFRAAEFEADGGNSLVIANQVYNAWRIREERRGATSTQADLDRQRRYEEQVVANRALILRRAEERRTAEQRRADGGNNGDDANATEIAGLPTEASFRAADLARTIERIAAIEVRQAQTGIQAMLEFQSQIVSFFLQRRFSHAQISSGFYRLIFSGSSQQLEVGREELASFFPNTDMSFTVNTIEFVSREAVNDVRNGMRAVDNAYLSGDLILALERLQETLLLGEHVPEVYQFPSDRRRKLLRIYRNMREARELANAKDYDGVETLVNELRSLAEDFPATRILSAVNTARSMSDFSLFAAGQYRNLGDIERARAELERAIEIWPSNPAIRNFQTETVSLSNRGSQGVAMFDELMARGSERDIYNRRMELGMALVDDTTRRPQLESIIERIARLDLLIAQSTEMEAQGNAFAAWDMLEEAISIDEEDARVNRARARLAPRVAEYARALDNARRNEEAGRYPAALAQYLTAQDIYPASRVSRLGIERTGERLIGTIRQRRELE